MPYFNPFLPFKIAHFSTLSQMLPLNGSSCYTRTTGVGRGMFARERLKPALSVLAQISEWCWKRDVRA